jgi:photosystem II stability/assembly factor-like uncharacterized protein
MKKIILILFLICIYTGFAEKHWVQKHFIEAEDIVSIQCLDSNECFGFAKYRWYTRIYKSTDQGETWEKIYELDREPPKDSVESIFFCQVVNKDLVFMSYWRNVILEKSNDGGKTFKRYTFGEYSDPEDFIRGFEMYNERIGVISSNRNFFCTKDGWETYKVYPKGEFIYAGIPMFFIDSNNIAIQEFQRRSDKFYILNLDNGDWIQYNEGTNEDPGKEMKDVAFINDTLGFVCGGQKTGMGDLRSNIIWKTTDKGKHWEIMNDNEGPITGFGLLSIGFREDGKHGMAAANWGVVIETTDGGDTWDYVLPSEKLEGILGPHVQYAGQYPLIGAGGGIFRYEDVTDVVSEEETENLSIQQTRDKLIIRQRENINKRISVQIADLLGRNVQSQSFVNQQEINLDISKLNSGFYVYNIVADGRILKTGKLVR